MTKIIENKYVTIPKEYPSHEDYEDGIGCREENHFIIRNCVVDFSKQDVEDMDEALGIIWGASAEIENCVFRGAAKLILLGCGDEDKIEVETGKEVHFKNCIFENFSRRGPEVQDGMKVIMENCLIQNWGANNRFLVRSFASWAHTENTEIIANKVIYKQNKFFHKNFLKDLIGHIGQAVNDSGIYNIFSKEAWQPGVCKGLVATCGGKVKAEHCYKNKWWINIENHKNPMNKTEAMVLEAQLEEMRDKLYNQLGIKR